MGRAGGFRPPDALYAWVELADRTGRAVHQMRLDALWLALRGGGSRVRDYCVRKGVLSCPLSYAMHRTYALIGVGATLTVVGAGSLAAGCDRTWQVRLGGWPRML